MKHLLTLFLLLSAIPTASHSQWLPGSVPQSMPLMGNGALLNYHGKLYFYNEEKHFQISSDNGKTWSDPTDQIGGANPHVAKLTAANGRIYGGLNTGTGQGTVIFSSDEGVTWDVDTLGAPGHALGWGGLPVVRDIYTWSNFLYVSWDGPNLYTIKKIGEPYQLNNFMVQGANNPSSVIAKGDTLFVASNKVYYTIDGGANWVVPANNGFAGYGGKLYVDGSRLYMFAYEAWAKPCQLFYSDDNAEHWTMIDISNLTSKKIINGDRYFPLAAYVRGSTVKFAADMDHFNTQPNVWGSTDLGATWSIDTAGLPTSFVNSAVGFTYSDDGNLWIVPRYNNMYKQKIDDGISGGIVIKGKPAVVFPPSGGMLADTFVVLSWTQVKGATSYGIEVATDAGFTNVVLSDSITATTHLVAGLDRNVTYYWRVRGLAAGINHPKQPEVLQAGEWSEVFSFTVKADQSRVREWASQVAIYPNPATDWLTCSSESKISEIHITDVLGRTIFLLKSATNFATVDISGIPPGCYYVILTSFEGKTSKKLVIDR